MPKLSIIIFILSGIFLSGKTAIASSLETNPIISGHEFRHQSQVLKQDRRFMISLPERYHVNELSYPSLYIIDADFQFQHVSAIVKNLTRMGKIPPMIVIGVANQGNADYLNKTTWPDKKDDAFGGAEKFQTYLTQELLPLVDSQYRTNHQKAIAGYSLGGLFSLYSMLQNKTPFNAFLAMSPSAWFDDNRISSKLAKRFKQGKLEATVFISLASEKGMGVDQVVEVFENAAPDSLKWQYKHYPDENHFTTALPALYDGLQLLAPDYAKDGSDMLAIGDYQQVLAHFESQQKSWGGFYFGWLQAYQFAKYVFWSKQTDKVENIVAAVSKKFPESKAIVSIHLATGFNKKQMSNKALKLLKDVQTEGEKLPGWHRQMSLYYAANNQPELADKHQKTAMQLAQQYQLESWEVWELQ